jgi:protein TonB
VSNNRFRYKFCSLLGAATLVCGTHLFLLATWNWDSATDGEPATPEATISIELSNRKRPIEPVAELEIAKDQLAGSSARPVALASSVEQSDTSREAPRFTASTEEQVQVALEGRPHVTAEAYMGDQTLPDSASVNISVAREEQPLVTADARVGDQAQPASASANVSVALEERPLITADARVGDQAQPASASASVSVEQPLVTAEALVGGQTLPFSVSANVSAEPATKDNAADSGSAPDATRSWSAETAEGGDKRADTTPMHEDAAVPGGERQISQPQLAASSSQKAEAAEPQRPEPVVNSSVEQQTIRSIPNSTQPQDSEQPEHIIKQRAPIATAVLNPQQSSLKAPQRKGTLKPSTDEAEPKLAANKPAPKHAAKATRHEQTSQLGPRPKPMGSAPADKPSLSLKQSQPKRRDAVIAAKQKPAPKRAAKSNPPQTESSQTPRWKPMALGPADKPSISLTQSQPKKPDARGYGENIWSALARRKPNAGQRGSTMVTFAIGPAGALRFVRVSQSSGNARLDQLALATVRAAAPFPPPPALKDGTAAYTLRIDFH